MGSNVCNVYPQARTCTVRTIDVVKSGHQNGFARYKVQHNHSTLLIAATSRQAARQCDQSPVDGQTSRGQEVSDVHGYILDIAVLVERRWVVVAQCRTPAVRWRVWIEHDQSTSRRFESSTSSRRGRPRPAASRLLHFSEPVAPSCVISAPD